MSGERDLQKLLKTMRPVHNSGNYVFCKVEKVGNINLDQVVMFFKENEAITLVLKEETAIELQYEYTVIMSWITLSVHSSLEAVGLTAAFSNALSNAGISCNVVAAYYHDHIFVSKQDSDKAMEILNSFSNQE
ncbi:ACT domain-containing protein [Flavobacterium zhairuonense]|uniref:ACT domain-containing protein n=1 Tax=Flavobacterium zhairuonense TaxID=2493631 RepID=UPI00104B21E9|nr:ACT domain-containing protein [Flavobacterium zhairuonense]KAF2509380.1 ACT domain-containing protein [Flavobacterium zhairuonense]